MDRLTLPDDLMTGIVEIDDQHRVLYAWADRILHEDPTAPALLMNRAMVFLSGYAVHHFAAEEAAMASSGFPGAIAHKVQHDGLRREVELLRKSLSAGGLTHDLRIRLHFLFKDWLAKHIGISDRALAHHLRQAADPDAHPIEHPPARLDREGATLLDEYQRREDAPKGPE